MARIRIYTDGSFRRPHKQPPRLGGEGSWAYIVTHGSAILKQKAGALHTESNNRMELTAILMAVVREPGEFTIVTDSQYCIDAIEKFRGASEDQRDRMLNDDLLRQIVNGLHRRDIDFEKVKGHVASIKRGQTEHFNHAADRLAAITRKKRFNSSA